uniref:Uncharacterized protein n=1 Tax=Romanomermis culicivorax TaxID=13658 RepID=A0A915KYR1_ROMCU
MRKCSCNPTAPGGDISTSGSLGIILTALRLHQACDHRHVGATTETEKVAFLFEIVLNTRLDPFSVTGPWLQSLGICKWGNKVEQERKR